jgi:hypothetical protein
VCSKFDLRRLCQAVGATPLVRLGRPLPEELGACSSVRTEEIGSTTGLLLLSSFVSPLSRFFSYGV